MRSGSKLIESQVSSNGYDELKVFWPNVMLCLAHRLVFGGIMTEEENEICSTCNGSGEGMYSDSTCSRCKGKGEFQSSKEDEEYSHLEDEWKDKDFD